MARANLLHGEIRYLKGIGPKRAKSFAAAGIRTVEDLLYYFPRRYEDRTAFTDIAGLKENEVQTIKAEVLNSSGRQSLRRRGFSITEAVVQDDTGRLHCVWFNQPYLKQYLTPGAVVILYGKTERYGSRLQMSAPEFEIIGMSNDAKAAEGESLHMGRIVPLYTLPEGTSQRSLRQLIKLALDTCLPSAEDFLPYDIRSRNKLLNLHKSLINIHFPESMQLQKEAYQRLAFDEFFLFQIPLALRKLKKKEKQGIVHQVEGRLVEGFIQNLPFSLTQAQRRVIAEIKTDMASPQVMHRLLQGDVGSGKTVVATVCGLMAVQGGFQVAFMVPTEILAHQHYDKITSQLLASQALPRRVEVGLLTSSIPKNKRREVLGDIEEGRLDFVIGTHALLEEQVSFRRLGLVVIDEQHKFGVGQRALLPAKAVNPDVLIMTATPIPRTLAITIYGDLDISVINELPPGRLPVKTMHFRQEEADEAYKIAKEQLACGRQVYIVYPVIEESYALDISGAERMYRQLKSGEFSGARLGLVHGRMKQKEQDNVMSQFKSGDIDVLVATTVLEVGIDMPNATCMIVAHADRFGLAQLHQLRGRVGRGGHESFCLLVSDAATREAQERLEAMVRYSDGFRIAEEDLKIRGPGEFFGSRQHGLTELKIANPLTQMQLLKRAREEATGLIGRDARLQEPLHRFLKEELLRRFPAYEELMMVA